MKVYKLPRVLTFKNLIGFIAVMCIAYLYITLTSCGAYKRRIIAENCVNKDTVITIHDTVKTETVKADTFFNVKSDTVYLTKDKLRIKYVRLNDTVYLTGECLGDTVYLTRQVKVSNPCPTFSLNWFQRNATTFFLLLVIIGLWQLVKGFIYKQINRGS